MVINNTESLTVEITDVLITLPAEPGKNGPLLAYARLVFDGQLIVHDVRLISSPSGLHISMPSRKVSDHCPDCGQKNWVEARYCSSCGLDLPPAEPVIDKQGRKKLWADIVHPLNNEFRAVMTAAVLSAYQDAVKGKTT